MIGESLRAEYDAVLQHGGLAPREDRGLIAVTGSDRADWLSNLVTNVVKTLSPGEGNYAFAVNVKGRVIFDVNLLVGEDAIWLDVDRRWTQTAMQWLDRYHINEDVALADRSDEQGRLAVIGPPAASVCQSLGFGNLVPMPWLQHISREIDGAAVTMFRHDPTGLIGAEFIVSGGHRDVALARIRSAADQAGAVEAQSSTLETLRIEAGIPASVIDIDDEVVAPETCQIERGISYGKGCYLGQEVIERMRARGAPARRLVGLRLEGDTLPNRNAPIFAGENEAGRITSACHSPALDAPLALGYVKAAHAGVGTNLVIPVADSEIFAAVVALPVRAT